MTQPNPIKFTRKALTDFETFAREVIAQGLIVTPVKNDVFLVEIDWKKDGTHEDLEDYLRWLKVPMQTWHAYSVKMVFTQTDLVKFALSVLETTRKKAAK